MRRLVPRSVVWLVTVALVFLGAFRASGWLQQERHPQVRAARDFVSGRIGGMTPEQQSLVDRCVTDYPMESMFAVYAEGLKGIERLHSHGPDARDRIAALVMRSCLHGADGRGIDTEAAGQFADSAWSLIVPLQQIDGKYAEGVLTGLEHLSPLEYPNVASDASYVQIVSAIAPRWRDEFRRNQDVLTPVLAMADPNEWNGILADFAAAQPRVGQIIRDPGMGLPFGLVYMLHREAVRKLQAVGVSESRAIEFVGVNAQAIGELAAKDPAWAGRVKALEGVKDVGGTSLFDWACGNPPSFRVFADDPSPDKADAVAVLKEYAGTELPAVLAVNYASKEMLPKALESIAKLDKLKPGSAASFLVKYQGNEDFKALLAKHGPRLIAALSAGEATLDQIKGVPGWIDKLVDENCRPRGTPLWTYLPGGSIALVIREQASGRPVTWGEIAWAGVDAATFIFVAGKLVPIAKGGLTVVAKQGLKAGAKSILRREAEAVAEETMMKSVAKGTGKVVAQGIAETAGKGPAGAGARSLLLARSYELLAAGGKTVSKAAIALGGKTISFAAMHPIKTGVSGLLIYAAVTRGPAAVAKVDELLRDPAPVLGKTMGNMLGGSISGIWSAVKDQASQQPMLAPVFYAIGGSLILLVILLPLALLRWLIRPLYGALGGVLRGLVAPVSRLIKRLARGPRDTPASPGDVQ